MISRKLIISLISLCILSLPLWSQDDSGKPDSIPEFVSQGHFGGSLGVGFLSANSGNYLKGEPGTVGQLIFSYVPWDFHDVGLGVGSQLPGISSEFVHMPVFLHYKSWISQKPMVKVGVNGGYGVAFTDEFANITEARGGLMANPFIGIKLNKSADWAWTLDFGLLYQKLYYKYGDIDIWENQTEYDLKLWRFMFTTTFEI